MSETRKCSSCPAPAVVEIVDADSAKGNLACLSCATFWPLSEKRRLDDG